MKRYLLTCCFILSAYVCLYAQSGEWKYKPMAEIFTDFHYNLTDTTCNTGFDLNRAYIGYQIFPGGNLSAKLIVNIGTPDDLAEGSEPRRYAYCREASLIWSDEKLTVSMGITGTRIFGFQQRFWGKRYIAKPYQAINGYGYVADLGVAVDYVFTKLLSADFTVMNGEGYSSLQSDNNLRTSLGLTLTPTDILTFRVYADMQKVNGLSQVVLIGFAGVKTKLLTLGGEVSSKSNIDLVKNHHAWGISGTGSINISENTEIFGRMDFISSVVLPDQALKWNYLNDGTFLIAGVQRTISGNAKIALNYQGMYPYSTRGIISDLIFVNALFKF